jgi:hypothetical protein
MEPVHGLLESLKRNDVLENTPAMVSNKTMRSNATLFYIARQAPNGFTCRLSTSAAPEALLQNRSERSKQLTTFAANKTRDSCAEN